MLPAAALGSDLKSAKEATASASKLGEETSASIRIQTNVQNEGATDETATVTTEIVDATVSASSKPYFTRDRTGSNTEESMRTSDAGGIRGRRPHERTTVTEGERGKSPPSHYVGRFWSDAWLTKALSL